MVAGPCRKPSGRGARLGNSRPLPWRRSIRTPGAVHGPRRAAVADRCAPEG